MATDSQWAGTFVFQFIIAVIIAGIILAFKFLSLVLAFIILKQ